MIRLLLIIAAKYFLMRLTCAEPIAIQVIRATVRDGRWIAIDSAHVATVQSVLERTRQAGQPDGSTAPRLRSRTDVSARHDKPP